MADRDSVSDEESAGSSTSPTKSKHEHDDDELESDIQQIALKLIRGPETATTASTFDTNSEEHSEAVEPTFFEKKTKTWERFKDLFPDQNSHLSTKIRFTDTSITKPAMRARRLSRSNSSRSHIIQTKKDVLHRDKHNKDHHHRGILVETLLSLIHEHETLSRIHEDTILTKGTSQRQQRSSSSKLATVSEQSEANATTQDASQGLNLDQPSGSPAKPALDNTSYGVIVAGSIATDIYVHVVFEGFNPPTTNTPTDGLTQHNGGKGMNAAVQIKRLGVNVSFVGCIGEDATGQELRNALQLKGVDVSHLAEVRNEDDPSEPIMTGTAVVLRISGARVTDNNQTPPVTKVTMPFLASNNKFGRTQAKAIKHLAGQKILVMNLEINHAHLPFIAKHAAGKAGSSKPEERKLVILKTSPLSDKERLPVDLLKAAHVLLVNEFEANRILFPSRKGKLRRLDEALECCLAIQRRFGSQAVVLTTPSGFVACVKTSLLSAGCDFVQAVTAQDPGERQGDKDEADVAVFCIPGLDLIGSLQESAGNDAGQNGSDQEHLPNRCDKDPVGCADSSCGSMVAALAKKQPFQEALLWGLASSAIVFCYEGAQDNMPNEQTVKRVLERVLHGRRKASQMQQQDSSQMDPNSTVHTAAQLESMSRFIAKLRRGSKVFDPDGDGNSGDITEEDFKELGLVPSGTEATVAPDKFVRDFQGQSALHLAVVTARFDVVSAILRTWLKYLGKGNIRTIDAIVSESDRDSYGKTPKDRAKQYSRFLKNAGTAAAFVTDIFEIFTSLNDVVTAWKEAAGGEDSSLKSESQRIEARIEQSRDQAHRFRDRLICLLNKLANHVLDKKSERRISRDACRQLLEPVREALARVNTSTVDGYDLHDRLQNVLLTRMDFEKGSGEQPSRQLLHCLCILGYASFLDDIMSLPNIVRPLESGEEDSNLNTSLLQDGGQGDQGDASNIKAKNLKKNQVQAIDPDHLGLTCVHYAILTDLEDPPGNQQDSGGATHETDRFPTVTMISRHFANFNFEGDIRKTFAAAINYDIKGEGNKKDASDKGAGEQTANGTSESSMKGEAAEEGDNSHRGSAASIKGDDSAAVSEQNPESRITEPVRQYLLNKMRECPPCFDVQTAKDMRRHLERLCMGQEAFLSYGRNVNAPFVSKFVESLQEHFERSSGRFFSIWWDKALPAGCRWQEVLAQRTHQTRIFIFMVTNKWLASYFCQSEFFHAVVHSGSSVPARCLAIIPPLADGKLQEDDYNDEKLEKQDEFNVAGRRKLGLAGPPQDEEKTAHDLRQDVQLTNRTIPDMLKYIIRFYYFKHFGRAAAEQPTGADEMINELQSTLEDDGAEQDRLSRLDKQVEALQRKCPEQSPESDFLQDLQKVRTWSNVLIRGFYIEKRLLASHWHHGKPHIGEKLWGTGRKYIWEDEHWLSEENIFSFADLPSNMAEADDKQKRKFQDQLEKLAKKICELAEESIREESQFESPLRQLRTTTRTSAMTAPVRQRHGRMLVVAWNDLIDALHSQSALEQDADDKGEGELASLELLSQRRDEQDFDIDTPQHIADAFLNEIHSLRENFGSAGTVQAVSYKDLLQQEDDDGTQLKPSTSGDQHQPGEAAGSPFLTACKEKPIPSLKAALEGRVLSVVQEEGENAETYGHIVFVLPIRQSMIDDHIRGVLRRLQNWAGRPSTGSGVTEGKPKLDFMPIASLRPSDSLSNPERETLCERFVPLQIGRIPGQAARERFLERVVQRVLKLAGPDGDGSGTAAQQHSNSRVMRSSQHMETSGEHTDDTESSTNTIASAAPSEQSSSAAAPPSVGSRASSQASHGRDSKDKQCNAQ